MKLTKINTNPQTDRTWYLIDAEKVVLGRLATKVAELLLGKHKVDYDPTRDRGDFIVITNIAKIKFTGNKLEQKKYYKYSGYPGGLSTKSLKELWEKDPVLVITKAISGMIPKNRLRKARMKRLKIYLDDKHKHQAQKLEELKIKR
ncbi:50S ribosomal protein L13 [Patescibacteria group bacterium]